MAAGTSSEWRTIIASSRIPNVDYIGAFDLPQWSVSSAILAEGMIVSRFTICLVTKTLHLKS